MQIHARLLNSILTKNKFLNFFMSQYIWREVSQLSDFAFQMFTFVTFFICLGAFVKHDFENHYIWY